jgi:hypothetical protein
MIFVKQIGTNEAYQAVIIMLMLLTVSHSRIACADDLLNDCAEEIKQNIPNSQNHLV